MAELLVRVRDKINAEFYSDCQCTKRGDVIVVQPDGWAWGNDEKTLPCWRILQVPVLSLSEARALCSPELPVDPVNPSRTLRVRAFRLDISNVAIPQSLKKFIADDTRSQPAFMVNLSLSQMRALKITKSVIFDPNVLGGSPVVIG